jgi:hypothetical protein
MRSNSSIIFASIAGGGAALRRLCSKNAVGPPRPYCSIGAGSTEVSASARFFGKT